MSAKDELIEITARWRVQVKWSCREDVAGVFRHACQIAIQHHVIILDIRCAAEGGILIDGARRKWEQVERIKGHRHRALMMQRALEYSKDGRDRSMERIDAAHTQMDGWKPGSNDSRGPVNRIAPPESAQFVDWDRVPDVCHLNRRIVKEALARFRQEEADALLILEGK